MPDKKVVKSCLIGEDEFEFPDGDMLVHVVSLQKSFMTRWYAPHIRSCDEIQLSSADSNGRNHPSRHGATSTFIRHNLECINNEVEEIRDYTPWKHWKQYPDHVLDLDEIRMEYIDLLHFVLEGMCYLGMTGPDIYRYYISKHLENLRRQREGYIQNTSKEF